MKRPGYTIRKKDETWDEFPAATFYAPSSLASTVLERKISSISGSASNGDHALTKRGWEWIPNLLILWCLGPDRHFALGIGQPSVDDSMSHISRPDPFALLSNAVVRGLVWIFVLLSN